MNTNLKLLLLADLLLRMIGIACFTLFIAAIYQQTGKTSYIGFISVATLAPSLLVTFFAGKYTARFSSLGILRYVTLLRIILFFIVGIFADGPIAILIAAGVQSLTHQISISAKMTLDAEVVHAEIRRAYIAKKMMLANLAIIIGPPLGGVLISGLGLRTSMFVMFGLSGVAALVLAFVSKPVLHVDAVETGGSGVMESIKHLVALPKTATIIAIFCLISVILEVQAPILFPFVKEVYAANSDFTGLLLGLAGFGGILGAILAERFPNRFAESSIPWLVMADGIIFLIFTQLREPIIASILFTALGMMGAVTLIIVEGVVQKDVGVAHRPFVFSLMQLASGAGGASLGIVAAFLAEGYGAKIVLASAAAVEIIFGGLCLLGGYFLTRGVFGVGKG